MSAVVVISPEELQRLIDASVESAVERAISRLAPTQSERANGAVGLLDREEVMERLCISRSALYDLRRRGELSAVHLGARQVRYRAEDVERLMREGAIP